MDHTSGWQGRRQPRGQFFGGMANKRRIILTSCRDLSGTEHSVAVTAETLYEAAAQALGILRGDVWVEEIGEGLTEVKVRIKQPAVEHRVHMKDFRRWLESQGRTPAECIRKLQLQALVKGDGRER